MDSCRHRHTYEDGQVAEVGAQYLYSIWRTVYRWRLNGQPIGSTAADCTPDNPPDWTRPPRPRPEEDLLTDIHDFPPARLLRLIAEEKLAILDLPAVDGETRHLLVIRSNAKSTEFPADLLSAYEELVASNVVARPDDSRCKPAGKLAAPAMIRTKMGLPAHGYYPARLAAMLPSGERLHKRWSALKQPASA